MVGSGFEEGLCGSSKRGQRLNVEADSEKTVYLTGREHLCRSASIALFSKCLYSILYSVSCLNTLSLPSPLPSLSVLSQLCPCLDHSPHLFFFLIHPSIAPSLYLSSLFAFCMVFHPSITFCHSLVSSRRLLCDALSGRSSSSDDTGLS